MVITECFPGLPTTGQYVEIVERKGIGHPDTICDSVTEAASTALASILLVQGKDCRIEDVNREAEQVLLDKLSQLAFFCRQLATGSFPIC